MGDFEVVHFKDLFGNEVTIKCCHFHFCQSLYRRVLTMGLSRRFVEGDTFKLGVKMLMATAYLPEDVIVETFKRIKSEMCGDEDFEKFLEYFENNYIKGVFRTANWSVFGLSERTNNRSESFHSALNRYIGTTHPVIHKFLEKLLSFQKIINLKYQAYETDLQKSRQSYLSIKKNLTLEELQNQLIGENKLDPIVFLKNQNIILFDLDMNTAIKEVNEENELIEIMRKSTLSEVANYNHFCHSSHNGIEDPHSSLNESTLVFVNMEKDVNTINDRLKDLKKKTKKATKAHNEKKPRKVSDYQKTKKLRKMIRKSRN
ncbi:hypothetical protein EIN_428980 [Entamoeba invadens IP1]|uniref:MULE transposase domain-containing protein n=1 Tax=Entamoeba invadens IP1 TaxID=370355 RepID=A0A0A1UHD9_ENTIV|nr:hypothetical protein EIN_428980 [Entamoeba invadens IP1]ELP95152.1 hypothetical protein EIN_428980 [Entamoeba invadens IP1]|eukprot:XP_004261923.1 hypothetical protein EIN_428980 [Entamoeba invadens IP1]